MQVVNNSKVEDNLWKLEAEHEDNGILLQVLNLELLLFFTIMILYKMSYEVLQRKTVFQAK